MHKPFGGIIPFPLVTLATSVSMPIASLGAQAASLNAFGAPATPTAWQAMQACWYLVSTSKALADTDITRVVTNVNSFFMAFSTSPIKFGLWVYNVIVAL
jgi:hypothetical protein